MVCKLRCRDHYTSTTSLIGGGDVDETIIAVFSALLWHTQSLREDIDKYR